MNVPDYRLAGVGVAHLLQQRSAHRVRDRAVHLAVEQHRD